VKTSRRGFLAGSAAAALSAGVVADTQGATAPAPSALDVRIPFDGPHQAGVVTPGHAEATYAALDVITTDLGELARGLEALSSRARDLTQGSKVAIQEVDDPPSDSGTLGPTIAPGALTVTIGLGASLFDERFGFAARKPQRLIAMPNFPDDELDLARSHGDVLLQICADQRDTVVHTLRELMRPVRSTFALRWAIDGFQSADRGPTKRSARRNLFGFPDGTGNPDVNDDALMRRLVWVPADGDEPAWTTGGTYQIVRVIRMQVEFWDRVGLREQENMIGRRRDNGAPLGGTDEFQDPRYDLDPKGDRIGLDAHIRLANPRTPATDDQRILRRAFNYHRGFDSAGQLDQGLLFVAFNQDTERQFVTVQKRLAGEPMVDYITPVGGGYFFVPPGAKGPGDWVGSGLFT
jgi:deferrochelatase/peroxidase EfeB